MKLKSTVINLIVASGVLMVPEAFAVRTINVAPAGKGKDATKALRKGVTIESNAFTYTDPNANPLLISAKAVDGLTVRRNTCNVPANPLQTTFCTHISSD